MLETVSAVGSANKNPEQGDQEVQVENRDEKELAQKSYKGQKTTKSKKWIKTEKAEASKVKNLGQSGIFLTANTKKTFIELRQVFVEALILNHFDPEDYI